MYICIAINYNGWPSWFAFFGLPDRQNQQQNETRGLELESERVYWSASGFCLCMCVCVCLLPVCYVDFWSASDGEWARYGWTFSLIWYSTNRIGLLHDANGACSCLTIEIVIRVVGWIARRLTRALSLWAGTTLAAWESEIASEATRLL